MAEVMYLVAWLFVGSAFLHGIFWINAVNRFKLEEKEWKAYTKKRLTVRGQYRRRR